MRRKFNSDTKIGELLKEIKATTTSATFHLSKDLKIILTAFRLCSCCGKWFRNGDMEGEICFDCAENGRKIECNEQEKNLHEIEQEQEDVLDEVKRDNSLFDYTHR